MKQSSSSSPRRRGSINFVSTSEEETKEFAKKLAARFKTGVIALTGDLGAGKTTFVQGFGKGLGIKEKIISPTFVIVRQHPVPRSQKILYHVDLYRLEDNLDIKNLGLEEIWSNSNSIVLIEWAEKIRHLLSHNTLWIHFETNIKNQRQITIE